VSAVGCSLAAKPLFAAGPTAPRDVTAQRKTLAHLAGLPTELGTAVLLIPHDLGLAAERAEHLIVMRKGRIVESGPALEILKRPQHPYTQKLVAAAPSPSQALRLAGGWPGGL